MSKTIIVGKNGFIAKELFKVGLKNVLFTTSSDEEKNAIYLDLENVDDFNFSIIDKETIVVLLAAISSPDICQNDCDYAYNINVKGTIQFIENSLKKDAKVLFFASDVIYGNTTKPVNEKSSTNPFGNYAQMKDEVEKYFIGNDNFKSFRLSYVLSKEDKYLKYLKSCVENSSVAEVFHPFERKVIYIEDVLEAIKSIIQDWKQCGSQYINICGSQSISRKDIADYYNESIGGKLKYEIFKPNDEFWKARPKDINIESLYLEKLLNRKPIEIKDAVNKIIKGDN